MGSDKPNNDQLNAKAGSFNRSGLVVLMAACFIAVAVFIYAIYRNPGPIDSKWGDVMATGISHDEIVKRESEFRKSTPESIENGKALYAVNCAGCHSAHPAYAGQDFYMKRIHDNQLKLGSKETDIYRIIFRGIPVYGDRLTQTMPRQDSISDPNRWAIVHYIRSLMPNAPSANASDWKALDDEKIW